MVVVVSVVAVFVPSSAVVAAFGCEVKDACSVRAPLCATSLASCIRLPCCLIRLFALLTLAGSFCFPANRFRAVNAYLVELIRGGFGRID